MKAIRFSILVRVVLFAVFAAAFSLAQEQVPVPTGPPTTSTSAVQQKVFVFVQRTDRHAKYSNHETFQNVVNDLMEYLKTKNVAIAVDEFGGRNAAEGATPLDIIFNIARDAKANSVLYVVVDRPVTKWLKITAQCLDMNGKQIWQEEASSGGGMSGEHGFEVSTKKLHEQLERRIGQPGLPILSADLSPVSEK